jgi:integrase
MNTTSKLVVFIEDNIKQGFFEHDAFETLKSMLPFYMRGFVTFAYMTGWRVAEVVNLTWSQVDIENRIVHLEPMTTKNNEGRSIYLNDCSGQEKTDRNQAAFAYCSFS